MELIASMSVVNLFSSANSYLKKKCLFINIYLQTIHLSPCAVFGWFSVGHKISTGGSALIKSTCRLFYLANLHPKAGLNY